jgi:hypothetical protein
VTNPFLNAHVVSPLIAVCGQRGGYIQVAANQANQHMLANVPETVVLAALAWAKQLELLGAKRVYWFCLSEQQPHYHWHIYPRWHDEEARGWDLFSLRATEMNTWNTTLQNSLSSWATMFDVICM